MRSEIKKILENVAYHIVILISILVEFEKIESDNRDCWHATGTTEGENRLRKHSNTGITLEECKKFCAALDGCIGINWIGPTVGQCYGLKSCENPRRYDRMEYHVLKGMLMDLSWSNAIQII